MRQKSNIQDLRVEVSFLFGTLKKILSKKKKLKLSTNYFIYILSCGKYYQHNHNKLIDKAFKKFQTDMNIKHLLHQVILVDKLKKLILTNEQIIIFDFFPKKLITLEEKVILDTHFANRNNHKQKELSQLMTHKIQTNVDYLSFQKLLHAFENITTTQTSDETTQHINNKLVFLLGTELRSVFKASLLVEKLDHNTDNLNSNEIESKRMDGISPLTIIDQMNIGAKSKLIHSIRGQVFRNAGNKSRFMSDIVGSSNQFQEDRMISDDNEIPEEDPYLNSQQS